MLGQIKRKSVLNSAPPERTVEDDEKLVDMAITQRIRNPDAFLESTSPFESQFRLSQEFKDKYEYKELIEDMK